MALIKTLVDKDEYEIWLGSRPKIVQEVAKLLPPDRLYLMKSTGNRVYLHAYAEDGTVSVVVSQEYNCVFFSRIVTGVSPDDLEECDLPTDSEINW